MAWKPERLECMGHYGYGTGYYAHEGQKAAKTGGEAASFCDRCRGKSACWVAFRARVGAEQPEKVAEWDEAARFAEQRGISPGVLAANLAAAGTPDPWMGSMLTNMRRGIDEREATNPPKRGRR